MSTVHESSRRLYESLLQPFGDRIPRSRVLSIDADGLLSGVPWSALEDRTGTLLLERTAISQVTGWTEAIADVNGPPIQENPLIIGPPQLRGELAKEYPRLPELQAEAAKLHGLLPQAFFFDGPRATVDALLGHLSDVTMIHFGGHGIGYGEFGGLLLAPSESDTKSARFFTADQVASRKLPKLQLVVLAACSSGEGEQIGAVNLDSLTRAFLESGAKRVIATRWNVSSGQSKHLISRFYDLALQRTPPAEALRHAALEVRASSSAHPYYWAGFQVFGAP